MEISVIFDEGIEEDESPAAEWLKSIIEKVLAAEGADASSEVSLLITGQERIHELNREYLDEDRPTDVLSFPMLPGTEGTEFVSPPDGMSHLGEIVISLAQATIQAKERGHSRERELAILIIHGVLHLLGYDHDIEERESLMQGREQDILGSLNTN